MRVGEMVSGLVHQVNFHYYPQWQERQQNNEVAALLYAPIQDVIGALAPLGEKGVSEKVLATPSRLLNFLLVCKENLHTSEFQVIIAGVNALGVILEHGGTILFEYDQNAVGEVAYEVKERHGFNINPPLNQQEEILLGRIAMNMFKKSSQTAEITLPSKRLSDSAKPVKRHLFDKFSLGMKFTPGSPLFYNSADLIGQRALIGLTERAIQLALGPGRQIPLENPGKKVFDLLMSDIVAARIENPARRGK